MFYSSNLNNLSVFVQFCTHTLQFICENSCLNSANFTCRVIVRVILENFSLAQKCYTQVSFVIFVTNSMSLYFPFGLFLFGLFVFLYFCLFALIYLELFILVHIRSSWFIGIFQSKLERLRLQLYVGMDGIGWDGYQVVGSL